MLNNSTARNFVIISFFSILITRLIPHPPNFTATIAIAFYLPALFSFKYIIVALLAFVISDIIIGTHQLLIFTWGSIVLIGAISYFFSNFFLRLIGVTSSCIVFFLLTNFGVWLLGDTYTDNFSGLLLCYTMGLPFLQNSLLSTLFLAFLIELILLIKASKVYINRVKASSY